MAILSVRDVMNDKSAYLVNLLNHLFGYKTRVARWQATVWCKHGFQRRRYGEFVRFKRLWSKKNLLKNFRIKDMDCRN